LITVDDKDEEVRKTKNFSESEQAKSDYRYLLSTPEGYRFFKRFFLQNDPFSSSMTGNSRTFYLEGYRACALKMWDEITACDEITAAKLFIEILKANKEEFK
jgi:hypothetical protein